MVTVNINPTFSWITLEDKRMQADKRHELYAVRLVASIPAIPLAPWRSRLHPCARQPLACPTNQIPCLSMAPSQSDWAVTICEWWALDTDRDSTMTLAQSETGAVIHYKLTSAMRFQKSLTVRFCKAFAPLTSPSDGIGADAGRTLLARNSSLTTSRTTRTRSNRQIT